METETVPTTVACQNEEKKKWPELVGKDGKEAEDIIKKENPCLDVIVLPEGSLVTLDFRTDRVRIFVDCHGKVSKVPTIG